MRKFSDLHPKKAAYEQELVSELAEIRKVQARYEAQAASFHELHEWGVGIVATVEWLEGNLKVRTRSRPPALTASALREPEARDAVRFGTHPGHDGGI